MKLSRRQALAVAGGACLTAVAGAGLAGWMPGSRPATAQAAEVMACTTVTPEKEPGPYFVDVRLNRSDIRTDTSTGVAQAGIPLRLTLYVYNDDGCTPYEGAVVDIWNANAEGVYSDESSEDTLGVNYLRGYQVTDADGKVEFTTNMPGWYSGRTMHVHVQVRTFDSAANQTFVWQTQLFFGDTIDAEVAATYPYTTNPNSPRVVDADDRVWQDDWNGYADTAAVDDGAEVTPVLSGSTTDGYTASFSIVLADLPSTNADGFGGDTAQTGTTTAIASLRGFHWTRHGRRRTLVLATRSSQAVRVAATLRRGRRLLAVWPQTSLHTGARTVDLRLGEHVRAGAAVLSVTFVDAAGVTLTVRRALTVPRRLS